MSKKAIPAPLRAGTVVSSPRGQKVRIQVPNSWKALHLAPALLSMDCLEEPAVVSSLKVSRRK